MKRRKFSNQFKRQVVEEYLSGVSTAAQLMRRHDISSGLLYHWKDQYTQGRFDNGTTLGTLVLSELIISDRIWDVHIYLQHWAGLSA